MDFHKKIGELKEKRAKVHEDQKAVYEVADKEERALSVDEKEKYEKMDQEFTSLTQEIRGLEEDLERRVALKNREDFLNDDSSDDSLNKKTETRSENAAQEYRSAYFKMLTYGNEALDSKEARALQVGTDSEGGYLVPEEFEKKLVIALEEHNVLRSRCHKITTASDRKIPVISSTGAAAWTSEEAAYNESDDAFSQVTLSAHKLTRIIKVSEELLYDNVVGLENELALSFGRAFGTAEETAFMTGDGSGKPTGLMAATGGSGLGVTAAATAAITADELIDLYHSLGRVYRGRAEFFMKDATIKVIRKLKDSDDQYIWQPGLRAGEPDTLLGRPLVSCDAVASLEASAKTILFADLNYYYIADRKSRNFVRLNELYRANGQFGFVASQRVDGKLVDANAAKHLIQDAG